MATSWIVLASHPLSLSNISGTESVTGLHLNIIYRYRERESSLEFQFQQ